jgi:large subunit ribosomal protein L13
MKFSAFGKDEKVRDYSVKDEWKLRMEKSATRFEPKPEFSKRPFDPQIRHRIDEISNDLILRGLE